MTVWKDEELADIGGANELRVAPLRRDGKFQRPRIIWVVRSWRRSLRTIRERAGRGLVPRCAGAACRSHLCLRRG
jgi:hypothetical protein